MKGRGRPRQTEACAKSLWQKGTRPEQEMEGWGWSTHMRGSREGPRSPLKAMVMVLVEGDIIKFAF